MASEKGRNNIMDRRQFIKVSTVVGGSVLVSSADLEASLSQESKKPIRRNERSEMTYSRLGRTNFMSSRLVFGCGAALTGGKAVRLLDRAFEAGINHFDVGSNLVYKESERSLAPFMKAHRDDIWVVSKAPLITLKIQPDDGITSDQAQAAAKSWTELLNASLKELQTDYIDAYYLMAVDNPNVIRSEEFYKAFLNAKSAGKVGYFGLSTHKNAAKVMGAAIETGWYDLAMIGITPAGWYDWTTRELEEGTPTLAALQPLLKKARDAGIGLIAMKTVRYLAPMAAMGKGKPQAFDKIYSSKLKQSPLNPFQRACAYVLEHGMDVVNADMQNFKHLEENIVAITTSRKYFG
jgi:aryl-alcohol dehydrogenase-like predicted oxidoreductase